MLSWLQSQKRFSLFKQDSMSKDKTDVASNRGFVSTTSFGKSPHGSSPKLSSSNNDDVSFAEIINKEALDEKLEGDLRSKQFIYYDGEIAPKELLGLKLRTKYARLAEFTSLHIFVVTLRCDHSCPYCQVSRQSENKSKFVRI